MKTDPFHERLLQIVLSLPGAYEDRPWGSVHCKVAGKIFVGWGRHDDGEMEIGIRVSPELQSMLVASDSRFKIAKYVGKYGGVDMRIGPKPNWEEVEEFIVESYRIIAPKKLVKELDARRGVASAAQKEKPAAKAAAKPKTAKPAAERKTAKPAAERKTAKPAAERKTAKPAAKRKTVSTGNRPLPRGSRRAAAG